MESTPTCPGERDLIERARSGDREAFGKLFARYRESIYAVCLLRLRDTHLAEDATQDTFLRAFRSLGKYDAEHRFFSWLATIASNRVTDLLKKEGRSSPRYLLDSDSAVHEARDVADVVPDRMLLRRALKRLPLESQRVVVLHDVEDWTHEKIAAAGATTKAATRITLSRAHAKLRLMLRGLVIWWIGIRSRVQRRILSIAERIDSSTVSAFCNSSGAALIAGAAIFFVPQQSGPPPWTSPDVGAASGAYSSQQLVAISNHESTRPLVGLQEGNEPFRDAISIHHSLGPTGSHAVAPSSAKFGFEVNGPDGGTVWKDRTWFDCNGFGDFSATVPKSSPIQTTC